MKQTMKFEIVKPASKVNPGASAEEPRIDSEAGPGGPAGGAAERLKAMRAWKTLRRLNAHTARKFLVGVFRYVIIIGISYVILYPIFQMLSTAFKDPSDLYDITVVWVPKHFTLDNFGPVLTVMNYWKAFMNSLLLSLVTSVLHVVSCTLIGYGFARFEFKGRDIVFALVVMTLVVPPQTIMIPIFLHFRFFDIFGILKALTGREGILDSYWPFVLQSVTGMGFRNGLYILIFRQYFRGMSRSLEEAAWVEGSGIFSTFYRIMLPNAVPAIVTVFLFSFVWQWNDEYFVSLFLENNEVLPVALSALAPRVGSLAGDAHSLDPYYISLLNNTGSLVVIAPLLILYIFAQKYFVESIERSGLVG
jgi:multiple sugar transport system permease protein